MRFRNAHEPLRAVSSKSGWRRLAGTSHSLFTVVAGAVLLAGGVYVFAVNERAVYGYDIRSLEKEIATLKQENAQLRLREAEGRSLERVEAGSQNLRMEKAVPAIELSVPQSGAVALR